jgi:hypothetical protein
VFLDPEHFRERRREFLKFALLLAFVLLVGLFALSLRLDWHFGQVWRYETAGLLGASVGTAELLSRYRDAPSFVLLSPPGIGYIAINAGASLAAMGIVRAFDWRFGASGNAVATTQVLMAGFGAMALFRSSLLTVKAGNADVGIGPSSVLSIMMAASDRSADRLRAADRAGRVTKIMEDVSYEKAADALPTVAIALMQNLSPADAAALRVELESLKNNKRLPNRTRALLLGLKITDVVSTHVLQGAKDSLGGSILLDPVPTESTPGVSKGNVQRKPMGKTKRRAPVKPPPKSTRAKSKGNGQLGSTEEVSQSLAGVRPSGEAGFASKDLPQTPQTPDPPEDRSPPET